MKREEATRLSTVKWEIFPSETEWYAKTQSEDIEPVDECFN